MAYWRSASDPSGASSLSISSQLMAIRAWTAAFQARFCLSAISLGGLLVPLFLAVSLLSKDIERKTVYTILSRPISRSKYILGKFGGLVSLPQSV